jgi:hypothetical protein
MTSCSEIAACNCGDCNAVALLVLPGILNNIATTNAFAVLLDVIAVWIVLSAADRIS